MPSSSSFLPPPAVQLVQLQDHDTDFVSSKTYRYTLGLFFILLQCIVWIVAAVITQKLYEGGNNDDNNDSSSGPPPFLLTYIGMSLLSILVPIQYLRDNSHRICSFITRKSILEDLLIIESVSSIDTLDVQLQNATMCSSDYINIARGTTIQLTTDHFHSWNHRKHMTAAVWLMPAMLGADYFFNLSLSATSVASATVLVSTQSVFVFVLAALLKLEDFSMWKLFGATLGVIGTALTAMDDASSSKEDQDDAYYYFGQRQLQAIGGDICAVAAAVLYSVYTIQVKKFCPENEELFSMPLLLGYIGTLCLILMAPIGIYLGITQVQWSWVMFFMICMKGMMDFMITDYCLFRAIILTNATIATVGLGLTIPMAFGTDMFMGKIESVSIKGLAGALAVSVGFLIVNLVPEKSTPSTQDQMENSSDDNDGRYRPAKVNDDYISQIDKVIL